MRAGRLSFQSNRWSVGVGVMKDITKLRSTDLNLLVTLKVLLETRNVSRAAEELGLSQPAASHALNRLRETFQDPLLVRSGRSMVTTSKAELLLPKVRELLGGIEEILDTETAFDPLTSQRTFVVGTNGYASNAVLARLVEFLVAQAPQVNLHVVSVHEDVRELLAEGRIDVALLSSSMERLPESLMVRQLFRDLFVTTVRRGHPLATGEVTMARYAEQRHILVSPAGDRVGAVDQRLADAGLRRRVALVLSDYLAVPGILKTSDLVITTTRTIATMLGEHPDLVQVKPPAEVLGIAGGLHALWHERVQHDSANRWLRELILRASEGFSG